MSAWARATRLLCCLLLLGATQPLPSTSAMESTSTAPAALTDGESRNFGRMVERLRTEGEASYLAHLGPAPPNEMAKKRFVALYIRYAIQRQEEKSLAAIGLSVADTDAGPDSTTASVLSREKDDGNIAPAIVSKATKATDPANVEADCSARPLFVHIPKVCCVR